MPRGAGHALQDLPLELRRHVVRTLVLIELAAGFERLQCVSRLAPDRRFDEPEGWPGIGEGLLHRPRRPRTASSRTARARARNGLERKSSAPSSNTFTSFSSSPFAVSTTIGMSL